MLFVNGVQTLLRVVLNGRNGLPFPESVPGEEATLIEVARLQLLPATLLGHCLEPSIQDGGWRIVGIFLTAEMLTRRRCRFVRTQRARRAAPSHRGLV